jgi:hypothetical protein
MARVAPREDVPASIRKVPAAREQRVAPSAGLDQAAPATDRMAADAPSVPSEALPPAEPATMPQQMSPPRPVIAPLSPDRYQVRFTASKATCEKLRLAQDLLRHAIPDGDPAQVIDRALTLLLADVVRKKAAITANPRPRPASAKDGRSVVRRRTPYIPAHVRRAVWIRDGGRCAFRSKAGHRCDARAFLEYHHADPEGVGGEASEWNIELRCRAHNQYEAVLFYGPQVLQKRATRSGTSP